MLIFSLILLQIIIFIALITIFRNIMNKNVVSATKHLESLSQDFSEKEKEVDKRIEYSKQKAQEIILKAQEEAEQIRKENVSAIEQERDKILKQARDQGEGIIQQADKSRELLLSEIDDRITKQSVIKACELIQYALPEQFKKDVHSLWVEELIGAGFNKLENLRIPQDIREIKVVSAFPLTEQQRLILLEKLKPVLGADIKLKEENDSKLVAGLSIAIGGLVLDGSFKNKIQEGAKNI